MLRSLALGALLAMISGSDTAADDSHATCKAHLLRAARAPSRVEPRGGIAGALQAETNVLHYDLDIEIVPDDAWLGGSNTITALSLDNGLTSFELSLSTALAISGVMVDGNPTTWVRPDSSTVEIDLGGTYDAGELFEVVIAYGGNPVSGGFGSISFSEHGGAPLVFTLSEPWFCNTWWPAKEDNNDKATGDLRITVPNELTVASNGVLMGIEDVGDGRDRHHWSTAYQTAPYLFSFSAAVYNTFSTEFAWDGGTMPLDFFIFPSADTPSHRAAWSLSGDMLGVFGELFGLYPFIDEKYGIYHFGFGGGMEHQTMTGQGSFGESLTAHEAAHQWWGDMITCATWQDIWLNEGFATYSTALWHEHKDGGGSGSLHAYMAGSRPSSVDGSVYIPADEATNVNRIFSGNLSYRKGAWVLHQLRHVIGDDVFFQSLLDYRAAYEHATATTAQFQAIVEAAAGTELDWFFDEWVYDIGAVAYASGWTTHDVAGRTYVELFLRQDQQASYPIFTMPLDIHTSGNAVDVVWNDEPAEHFLFEVDGDVSTLQVDPEDWTLHTANIEIPFVEGPPRVIVTSPEPGAERGVGTVGEVSLTFHEDVVITDADVELAGDLIGPVDFTFAYDPGAFTATLTPAAALGPDVYTVTVFDTVVDVAAGLALDGEVSDPASPGALPSGEGLPGGPAVVVFTVSTSNADVNGDGVVDVEDLVQVILEWGTCPVPPADCAADVDGSGVVDVGDLVIVVLGWG